MIIHPANAGRMPTRAVMSNVASQHVEDVAILHSARSYLVRAPHVKLHHIRRFDDRLAAHLDGVRIAGEQAWPLCEAALETPGPGAMFAAMVRAIEDKREDRLERLFALAQAAPEAQSGMLSAFGWLEPPELRGLVSPLLNSSDPWRRTIGIAASSMHRIDPGLLTARRFEDSAPAVRARALRAAGELGRRDFASILAAATTDDDPACQFWAAWSAVLLGDRHHMLDRLAALTMAEGAFEQRAFLLVLLAVPTARAHDLLRELAQNPALAHTLIQGAGLAADPAYVPWLIGQMADDKLARQAGEAFSMISGADLAWLDLERKPPENIEAGPNDDPNDANVDMDLDDGLPWPDQALVQAWWTQHGPRFTQGTRHFVGAPVTRSHCIEVLKNGYQRQRVAAAYHLCLLNPGTPLFEWRAPAWRQQRELAQMS